MNLDPQQQSAVTTDSPRAMVIAGAGSGKTRVLIERIAYLVEHKKVSPSEVLAFTFTRKAAGEIKARLHERIGSKAYGVTMGTMHALALRMINRFGDVIHMKSKSVTVYSEWEEAFLLKETARDLGLFKQGWKIPKGEIDAVFNTYYQKGIAPEPENPVYSLFRAFMLRCRENNSMTYGELLHGLFALIPTMAKYLNVRHILVDEVQDIDAFQWEIIRTMEVRFKANLYVVGDGDQSIYEWRGADPSYLVHHTDEFDIYKLETNYRSMPEIVDAANRLIGHNQHRIPKRMVPARTGGAARVIVERDCDSQAIIGFIAPMGPDVWEKTAVLARTHSLLGKLDRLMEEAGIAHEYVGKTSALTNSEPFRRFHAFLKLTVNPFDNFSFLMIRDLLGITREEYADIRLRAVTSGKSQFQIYVQAPAAWLGWLHNDGLDMACRLIAERYPEHFPEALSFALAWVKDNPAGSDSIGEYLEWLATYDITDEIRDGEPVGVTLMTIHAAKGLEWPFVFVAGCNEGILPSSRALDNGELEAERRLAYVAWTRACDQLVLTVRPERTETESGRVFENPESRFIWESMPR